jgi:ribose 5-phosphate isomerase B
MEKICIASDHHGVKMKKKIISYLTKKGYEVKDLGPEDEGAVDYPVYAFKVAKAIQNGEYDHGILICFSGIGMSIACNRIKKVRCARVLSVDDVKCTRIDNDANVIALSSKTPIYTVYDMVDTFLNTPFSTEERHARRVALIDENNEL